MTEQYKGNVHLAAFGLGMALFLYNVGSKNKLNSVIYAAFSGWEYFQTNKHYRASIK